ncbi:MAG: hypothetical protein U1A78_31440 [Polyangia bacterium]
MLRAEDGLRSLYDEALPRFLESLRLREQAVPLYLSVLSGRIAERPVRLRTKRYAGAELSSLTVAIIEEDAGAGGAPPLRSLTVIGLPRLGSPLPILGMDLIALGGTLSLVALDLAPTEPTFWEQRCRGVLDEVHALAGAAVVHRKRPEFASATFSSRALIAGARPEGVPSAIAAAGFLLAQGERLYAATDVPERAVNAPLADPDLLAARQRAWLIAERHNRREHDALSRIFGAEIARKYLEDFLFN